MTHTPEQARTLWCPMVRVARRETQLENETLSHGFGDAKIVAGCNTDALGKNRVPASCRCIADQCAMWRWHQPYKATNLGFFSLQSVRYVPDGEPTHGFCGIAGRPEVSA